MFAFETIKTQEYGEIRIGWIRFLYGATAFLGLTVGGAMLLAPDESRKIVGFPYELPVPDPITYGALGGIWAMVGVLCLLGLRDPLQYLPLIAVQLLYKSSWFACVFFPLMIRGEFPDYGWATAVGNLTWILLDCRAMPWGFFFHKNKSLSLAELRAAADRRHLDGALDRAA